MAKTTTAKRPAITADMRAKPSGEIVRLPAHGKNTPDLVTEAVIMANVHDAISAFDTGDSLMGSAVQRMAYAVTAQHGRLTFDGASIGPLAGYIGSRDATRTFTDHIRATFIGKKPAKDDSHEGAAADRLYAKHNTLLNRSVALASCLAKNNVSLAAFDRKDGVWTVPAVGIFPPAVVPFGDLATKTIKLDGRGYGGTGKNAKGSDAFFKVQASVNQYVSANTPKAETPAGGAGAGNADTVVTTLAKTLKDAGIESLTNAAGDVTNRMKMLTVVFNLYVKDAGADMAWSDYHSEEQNMLTQMEQAIATLRHAAETKATAKSA